MGDESLRGEVIPGVDTHLDVHVGVVISDTGRLLRTLAVPTDKAGYFKLLSWASSLGAVRRAGHPSSISTRPWLRRGIGS